MVIRPKAGETYEIVYNTHKTESWDKYINVLDTFLGGKSASQPLSQWLKRASCCGLSKDPEWIVFT